MKNIIAIVQSTYELCSKLKIETIEQLQETMWSLGILNYTKTIERIIEYEEDTLDFLISFNLFDFKSKSELRKLINNNGLKFNNSPVPLKISDIKWIKLEGVEYVVIKKGKNEFDFIFKNFEL